MVPSSTVPARWREGKSPGQELYLRDYSTGGNTRQPAAALTKHALMRETIYGGRSRPNRRISGIL